MCSEGGVEGEGVQCLSHAKSCKIALEDIRMQGSRGAERRIAKILDLYASNTAHFSKQFFFQTNRNVFLYVQT